MTEQQLRREITEAVLPVTIEAVLPVTTRLDTEMWICGVQESITMIGGDDGAGGAMGGGGDDRGQQVQDDRIDRFLGEAEVERITNLSRTTRWRLERRGLFPKRRSISPNRVAWLETEIRLWLRSKADQEPVAA